MFKILLYLYFIVLVILLFYSLITKMFLVYLRYFTAVLCEIKNFAVCIRQSFELTFLGDNCPHHIEDFRIHVMLSLFSLIIIFLPFCYRYFVVAS